MKQTILSYKPLSYTMEVFIMNNDSPSQKIFNLKPIKKRKDPNDKINKRFFNMTDKQYEREEMKIKESSKEKKDTILTPINLEYSRYTEQIMATRPRFNAFDREILYACLSEQVEGNLATTLDSIYRLITGDNGKRRPMKPMTELIKQSLDKLLFCDVRIDLTEVCAKYGYNKGQPLILHTAILPGQYMEGAIVNGEKTTAIKFYEKSPLFVAAEVKNEQILSYDKSLLNVPIRNSPEVIVIKSYVLRRILEIISHKMIPTITFDDIWDKNQLNDASTRQKQRFREYICKMFDFWVQQKLIDSYQINKETHIPIVLLSLIQRIAKRPN